MIERKEWQWFKERRFGMFVHWGVYAVAGWQEQLQWRRHVPQAEYIKMVPQFNPVKFNPDEWIDLAEAAGCGYICFTAKHHDGFCMWDTKLTDYSITHTPYGRDVLAMLAEACHRRNMRLSIYYSCPDWHQPNYPNLGGSHQLAQPNPGDQPDILKYLDFVRGQMTELMSNYGEISQLFWDIPPRMVVPDINELVRKLQPNIMIDDRGYAAGDYSTPERGVPAGKAFSKMTEACQSVGSQSWGYRIDEDYYTPEFLGRCIDKILCMGGNYLLNVGPTAEGVIPAPAADIMRAIGGWYNKVREGFEMTEPASELCSNGEVMMTRKGDCLYAHFPFGMNTTGVSLHPISVQPLEVTLLNDGRPLESAVEQLPMNWLEGPSLHVRNIPAAELQREVAIIRLRFAPGVIDKLLAGGGQWGKPL